MAMLFVVGFFGTRSEFCNDLLPSPKPMAIQDSCVFNTTTKSKRGHFVKYAKLQSPLLLKKSVPNFMILEQK